MFHITITMMLGLAKFPLTGRDGDSNRFQLAGNLFLTQTHAYRAKVALGHLWYNSGPHFMGPYHAAQSGAPDARTFRPSLPLGSV